MLGVIYDIRWGCWGEQSNVVGEGYWDVSCDFGGHPQFIALHHTANQHGPHPMVLADGVRDIGM